MEAAHHSLADLFDQLGLANDETSINQFIQNHPVAKPEQTLETLPFWSPAQKQLLTEAREDDAAWSEPVDELDTLLRRLS